MEDGCSCPRHGEKYAVCSRGQLSGGAGDSVPGQTGRDPTRVSCAVSAGLLAHGVQIPRVPGHEWGSPPFSAVPGTCGATVTRHGTRPRRSPSLPVGSLPSGVPHLCAPLTSLLPPPPTPTLSDNFLIAEVSPRISPGGFCPSPMLLPGTFQNTSEPLLQASPPPDLPASPRETPYSRRWFESAPPAFPPHAPVRVP